MAGADAQTVSREQEETGKAAPAQNLVAEFGVQEIDLSEEWAALSEQLDVTSAGVEAVAKSPEEFVVAPVEPFVAEPDDTGAARLRIAKPEAESTDVSIPDSGQAQSGEMESEHMLELSVRDASGAEDAPILSADDFLNSLSSELDVVLPASQNEIPKQVAPQDEAGNGGSPDDIRETISAEHAGPLTAVFDEFRAGLDEADNDEDPETHYNLGIAYREMGLVEESISEFQKVAQWMDREAGHNEGRGKSDQAVAGKSRNGKRHVFRYAMQCYTLLGLAFMDKGESAIAAMWYGRALETPGLDQDSILALRYDLGVAQELAGDSLAARKTFSQVYGMNIDYRDVAERLAALGKG